MSQGTPPRNTLQEYRGSLLFRGGSWPLQVNVASFTAGKSTAKKEVSRQPRSRHTTANHHAQLPAACRCRRASLSMLNRSSDWSSMSAPGHGEPVRQRREMAEEAGLALEGGVRGVLESCGSRREPRRRRSFCMLDAR